jgi:ankyrin repeat protein
MLNIVRLLIIIFSLNSANASEIVKSVAGITPLMQAVGNNDLSGVEFFCKTSPQDVNKKNIGGATALHIAARNNNVQIIDSLLKCNANSNIVDNELWTPIMRAASFSSYNAIEELIKNGAKLDNKNNEGHSLIQIAVTSNCKECLDVIINQGLKMGLTSTKLLKRDIEKGFIEAKKSYNVELQQHLSDKLNMLYEVHNKSKTFKSNKIEKKKNRKRSRASRSKSSTLAYNSTSNFRDEGISAKNLNDDDIFDISINNNRSKNNISNNNLIQKRAARSNFRKSASRKINNKKDDDEAAKYNYSPVVISSINPELKASEIKSLNIRNSLSEKSKTKMIKKSKVKKDNSKFNYIPVDVDVTSNLNYKSSNSLSIPKSKLSENTARYKYKPVKTDNNLGLNYKKLDKISISSRNLKSSDSASKYKYIPVDINSISNQLEYNNKKINFTKSNKINSKKSNYRYSGNYQPKVSKNLSSLKYNKIDPIKVDKKNDIVGQKNQSFGKVNYSQLSLPSSSMSFTAKEVSSLNIDISKKHPKFDPIDETVYNKNVKNSSKEHGKKIIDNQLPEISKVKESINVPKKVAIIKQNSIPNNPKENKLVNPDKSVIAKKSTNSIAKPKKDSGKRFFLRKFVKSKDNKIARKDNKFVKKEEINKKLARKDKKDIINPAFSNKLSDKLGNINNIDRKASKYVADNRALSDTKNINADSKLSRKKKKFKFSSSNSGSKINNSKSKSVKKFMFSKKLNKNFQLDSSISSVKNKIFRDGNDENLDFSDDPEFQKWIATPKPEIKRVRTKFKFNSN